MTDVDGDLLEALHAELRRRYRKRETGGFESVAEQAVTSSELAAMFDIEDSAANPKTREALKVLMRERGLPIVSNNHGSWIPLSRQPIDDKLDELDGRIAGIQERKQLLEDNWDSWELRQRTRADGGDETLTDEEREFLANNPISKAELLAQRRGDDGA